MAQQYADGEPPDGMVVESSAETISSPGQLQPEDTAGLPDELGESSLDQGEEVESDLFGPQEEARARLIFELETRREADPRRAAKAFAATKTDPDSWRELDMAGLAGLANELQQQKGAKK